jgi:polysaccharide biosynthesis/export protein
MKAGAAAILALWAISIGSIHTAAQSGPIDQKQQAVAIDRDSAADPSGFTRWMSGRYRLTPSDVIELTFPHVPEFNQVVTVQPDGYITLRGVGDIHAQARTIPELRELLYEAYSPILRDPVISITLKEFEKPYFVAAGEVKTPGKFELRGATTVTQALALAGGFSPEAKHSQVLLFRRYSDDMLEVKEINVKKLYASKDMSEDYLLRPGDTVFVPRNVMSRLKPFLPTAGLGLYLNPLSW